MNRPLWFCGMVLLGSVGAAAALGFRPYEWLALAGVWLGVGLLYAVGELIEWLYRRGR